jgi:hypothetical protein
MNKSEVSRFIKINAVPRRFATANPSVGGSEIGEGFSN